MSFFERIIHILQFEMDRPRIYGWFHLICLGLAGLTLAFLMIRKDRDQERTLKTILLVYGIGALFLEILKQVIWSYHYDPTTQTGWWDYQWYAFPFQLCTTPIFVALTCAFLKKGMLRNDLLSFMAFVTILGSIATAFYPESCLVKTVMVDIHTMYLHLGSMVVSLYLLFSGEVKIRFSNLLKGYGVFFLFAVAAEILNVIIYHSGVLKGETFNMFYISPYFSSDLPVFDTIQRNVPFPVFLVIHLITIFVCAFIIYLLAKLIERSGLRRYVDRSCSKGTADSARR